MTPELGWLRPVRTEPIPGAGQVYPQEMDLGARLGGSCTLRYVSLELEARCRGVAWAP